MRHASSGSRLDGDGGAVIVEFALVLPILTLFVLGIFEYGLAFGAKNVMSSAVQLAARTDANQANNRLADQSALLAYAATMSRAKRSEMQFAIIYQASSVANGVALPPTANCLTRARAVPLNNLLKVPSGGDPCNIFSRDMILAAGTTPTGFATASNVCDTATAWDQYWCPTARSNQLANPQYVGIYVEVKYTTMTKVPLVPNFTFKDYAVYRLEPLPTS